jgi:CRISPR-associated protein Cmr5
MDRTIEQRRAEFSYKCIDIIKDLKINDEFKLHFKSLVKKLPVLILTNGFGNTIAFLLSKGKEEHILLTYIIARNIFYENRYTRKIFGINEDFFSKELKELLEKREFLEEKKLILEKLEELIFVDVDKYMIATEETLRLLNWMRRFVEVMIEDEKEQQEEQKE